MGDSQRSLMKQPGTWVWVALFIVLAVALAVLVVPSLGPAVPAPTPSTYNSQKEVVQ